MDVPAMDAMVSCAALQVWNIHDVCWPAMRDVTTMTSAIVFSACMRGGTPGETMALILQMGLASELGHVWERQHAATQR